MNHKQIRIEIDMDKKTIIKIEHSGIDPITTIRILNEVQNTILSALRFEKVEPESKIIQPRLTAVKQ